MVLVSPGIRGATALTWSVSRARARATRGSAGCCMVTVIVSGHALNSRLCRVLAIRRLFSLECRKRHHQQLPARDALPLMLQLAATGTHGSASGSRDGLFHPRFAAKL